MFYVVGFSLFRHVRECDDGGVLINSSTICHFEHKPFLKTFNWVFMIVVYVVFSPLCLESVMRNNSMLRNQVRVVKSHRWLVDVYVSQKGGLFARTRVAQWLQNKKENPKSDIYLSCNKLRRSPEVKDLNTKDFCLPFFDAPRTIKMIVPIALPLS